MVSSDDASQAWDEEVARLIAKPIRPTAVEWPFSRGRAALMALGLGVAAVLVPIVVSLIKADELIRYPWLNAVLWLTSWLMIGPFVVEFVLVALFGGRMAISATGVRFELPLRRAFEIEWRWIKRIAGEQVIRVRQTMKVIECDHNANRIAFRLVSGRRVRLPFSPLILWGSKPTVVRLYAFMDQPKSEIVEDLQAHLVDYQARQPVTRARSKS